MKSRKVTESLQQVALPAQAILCSAGFFSLALLIPLFSGCSGNSGSGSSGGSVTAPTNLSYPQTVINATAGIAISPDVPTVTGGPVNTINVVPTLPAGLTASTTGTISGIPTAASSNASYTVTASNALGSTSATIQIAVAPAFNLVYPQTSINATAGTAISPDVPTVTAGPIASISVSPALPAGLTLNTTTGAISGTPTAASSAATYTVTASNSVQSASAQVQISVTLNPPSKLVYPQTVINAAVATAISPDVPTVTGIVSSFTVSPALPAGLAINSTTGAITGTATTASATATYTVTAANASGSTTASLQITVVQPSVVYPQTTIIGTAGLPISSDTPAVTGTITGYSVSPALPAGLSLDPSAGTISGTPTTATAQATYTVTAQDAVGTITVPLTIKITPAPVVLYQGTGGIQSLHSNSNRLLSSDGASWILWDYSSANTVARGVGSVQSDVGGQIFAVQIATDVEIRSAVDGSQISTLPIVGASVTLPSDNSYVCAANSSGLTVWSTSGSTLVTRSGDYSAAHIYTATGKVLVAGGPAGQNVIESIDIASGISTISPAFQGTFQVWFGDGSGFETRTGSIYQVYSSAGVQQTMGTFPQFTGPGGEANGWLWFADSTGGNFAVVVPGAGTPTLSLNLGADATFTQVGSSVVVFEGANPNFNVIDLSGSSPVVTQYSLPASITDPAVANSFTAYTKNSNGEWAVGTVQGIIVDATNQSSPIYFGDGEVLAVATGGNTAAVATASGGILLFDLTTNQQTQTINLQAGSVQMTSDGAILAASNGSLVVEPSYSTLSVYSLPSLSLIQSFPHPVTGSGFLQSFGLSQSGITLWQDTGSPLGNVTTSMELSGLSSSPLIITGTAYPPPPTSLAPFAALSPDGTLFAGAINTSSPWIYKNGVLVAQIPQVSGGQSWPIGWIDNNHLLVGNFVYQGPALPYGYTGSEILDATGALVSTLPAMPQFIQPQMKDITSFNPNPQFPTPDWIFDMSSSRIYSSATGSLIWQSYGSAFLSSASATHVIYSTVEQAQVVNLQ